MTNKIERKSRIFQAVCVGGFFSLLVFGGAAAQEHETGATDENERSEAREWDDNIDNPRADRARENYEAARKRAEEARAKADTRKKAKPAQSDNPGNGNGGPAGNKASEEAHTLAEKMRR